MFKYKCVYTHAYIYLSIIKSFITRHDWRVLSNRGHPQHTSLSFPKQRLRVPAQQESEKAIYHVTPASLSRRAPGVPQDLGEARSQHHWLPNTVLLMWRLLAPCWSGWVPCKIDPHAIFGTCTTHFHPCSWRSAKILSTDPAGKWS